MTLLLIMLCPGLLLVGLFGGYMLRTVEMRPSHWIEPPRAIDERARSGRTWLLMGGDGQLMEGRWVRPFLAARLWGGNSSDYAAAWVGWDDEEIEWTPEAYLPCLRLPTADRVRTRG